MTPAREMGGIVHPPPAIARFQVVIKAYFDESGSHDKKQVFAIAGYVAPEEEWEQFSMLWEKVLRRPQIEPPLEYFHAVDLEGRGSGRFRKITQQERDTLKSDAVTTVVGSGILGIASAVIMPSYDKFIVGKAKKIVGDQYLLCFQHVNIEAVKRSQAFVGEDTKEPIAFIFEQHPRWSPLALELYNKMLSRDDLATRYRLGTIAFGEKQGYKPLQAADHLAYETYRYMTRTTSDIRPAMRRFLNWPQHRGRYFDDHGFGEFVKELKTSGKL